MTRGLIPALAETHVKSRKTSRFSVSGGGSGEGIRRLLAGELDLAASTRRANPNEEEQAHELGFQLNDPKLRRIIGVEVVSISVHPDNPTDSLTYDQVIGIFCTREIDNWSFLGQEDAPINAITRDPMSGTRSLFEDFFCGPKGIHPRLVVKTVGQIKLALQDDPHAISFVSRAEGAGKILGLRPDASGPPVRPSQQNIIRGAYPLYQDLYLFTTAEPSEAANKFVDWILSPAGQEVIDEQRFVPLFLRPETLNTARPLRETIHFEPGSTLPNQRSVARLQLLVNELQQRAGEYRHIVLEGYCDIQEENPIPLSKGRAEAVRDLLKREIKGMYFEIIPRGNASPIAPNNTPYGRLRNRRVQIYLAAEEAPGDDG
jgi:phosphate transport system substrate-binding protein